MDFYVQNAKMGGTLFREDQKMSKVDFFTPIVFSPAFNCVTSGSEHLLEIVDSYFYLGGKQVCAISGKIANNGSTIAYRVQNPSQPSLFTTALKVASYFTLVLPLIMLVAKAVLRATHHIEIGEKPTHSHSSKHKIRSYPSDSSRYSKSTRTSLYAPDLTHRRSTPTPRPVQPSVRVPPGDTTRTQTPARVGSYPSTGVILEKQEAPSLATLLTVAEHENLARFYESKGITTYNPRQPMKLGSLDLGIDFNESGSIYTDQGREERVTMRVVCALVFQAINNAIYHAPDRGSVQMTRCLLLNTDDKTIQPYKSLGLTTEIGVCRPEVEGKQLWLRRIIDALVERGYLFKLIHYDARGYHIQA
jgi:hypothetical protein